MIKEIQNNPFRILGVFSNSSAREIIANEGKMKAFLKVGKAVSFPLDLPAILPSAERSEAIVATAKSQIALPDDQIKYAQFWFINSTQIDNIAFNHLFKGDLDEAIKTFQKKRTASSLQNLVVCNLLKGNYQVAVQFASSLYSEFLVDFVNAVNQQAAATKQTLINQFVSCLKASDIDVLSLRTSLTDPDWTNAINSIVSKPIVDKLKSALETARASKDKSSESRLNIGKKLMRTIEPLLPLAKEY